MSVGAVALDYGDGGSRDDSPVEGSSSGAPSSQAGEDTDAGVEGASPGGSVPACIALGPMGKVEQSSSLKKSKVAGSKGEVDISKKGKMTHQTQRVERQRSYWNEGRDTDTFCDWWNSQERCTRMSEVIAYVELLMTGLGNRRI